MKVKDFQKLSNKEIYFTLQSNNTKHFSVKDTIYSVLNSGLKSLLIGSRNALMDIYFLSGIDLSIFFSP